jgi:hypothetical protein
VPHRRNQLSLQFIGDFEASKKPDIAITYLEFCKYSHLNVLQFATNTGLTGFFL